MNGPNTGTDGDDGETYDTSPLPAPEYECFQKPTTQTAMRFHPTARTSLAHTPSLTAQSRLRQTSKGHICHCTSITGNQPINSGVPSSGAFVFDRLLQFGGAVMSDHEIVKFESVRKQGNNGYAGIIGGWSRKT